MHVGTKCLICTDFPSLWVTSVLCGRPPPQLRALLVYTCPSYQGWTGILENFFCHLSLVLSNEQPHKYTHWLSTMVEYWEGVSLAKPPPPHPCLLSGGGSRLSFENASLIRCGWEGEIPPVWRPPTLRPSHPFEVHNWLTLISKSWLEELYFKIPCRLRCYNGWSPGPLFLIPCK